MFISTLLWGKAEKNQISQFLVLKHGEKRVMVKRQKSYNLMLDSACKHFPSIPRHAVLLQTNQLDVCGGHYVDITADIWDDLIDFLSCIEVTRAEMTVPVPLDAWPIQSTLSQANRQDSSDDNKVTINVIFPSGEGLSTTTSRATRVDQFIADASNIVGFCPTGVMALWGEAVLRADWSIGSYNIENGDSVNLLGPVLVAKPVIYLYSPSDIDVSVKLSLSPEWSFSVIYPVVPTKDHGRHLEWNVRTHQDGNLTENNSGLDVAYLFWEAEPNSHAPPPASKPQPLETFSPTSSSLSDADSIVIPVDKVSVYLDKALKVLGLHTEARTSFITYWLPYFLKHKFVALRFVPQSVYERAASLSISPQPDIVTRVFMLFKGVSEEHLANWSNAQMQAEKDVAWWVDVVGVDFARASDAALFRVLEWGGMEVRI